MYRLTKITDDSFNGKHPNGIFAGLNYKGTYDDEPIEGKGFMFYPEKSGSYFLTSTVIVVLKDGIFKTKNSTYQLKEIEDNN